MGCSVAVAGPARTTATWLGEAFRCKPKRLATWRMQLEVCLVLSIMEACCSVPVDLVFFFLLTFLSFFVALRRGIVERMAFSRPGEKGRCLSSNFFVLRLFSDALVKTNTAIPTTFRFAFILISRFPHVRYYWHNTSGRSQWQRPEESGNAQDVRTETA